MNKLNDSLHNIIQTAKGTGTFLSEISEISHQQNKSIHEVTARLSTLNDTVRENAGQVEASAHTFTSLLEQTERLNTSVSLFILPSTEDDIHPMLDQRDMPQRIPVMG